MSSDAHFLTTRWSCVLAAGEASDLERARAALAELCEGYWWPLYAYARRRGWTAEDASDVVQAFFARLLEKRDLSGLSPEGGRFRAWLLASLKNFLSNWRDKEQTLKRGGGRVSLSIDFEQADRRWQAEPATEDDAERLYEKSWAVALLERSLAKLREEYERSGRGTVYAVLAPELQAGAEHRPYAELAADLGMTEGAVKVAVHRLRQRWADSLCAEIAHTVASEDEVEDETRALFDALGA